MAALCVSKNSERAASRKIEIQPKICAQFSLAVTAAPHPFTPSYTPTITQTLSVPVSAASAALDCKSRFPQDFESGSRSQKVHMLVASRSRAA